MHAVLCGMQSNQLCDHVLYHLACIFHGACKQSIGRYAARIGVLLEL
jgi:hypothetical protein